jgi:hypothetical protein
MKLFSLSLLTLSWISNQEPTYTRPVAVEPCGEARPVVVFSRVLVAVSFLYRIPYNFPIQIIYNRPTKRGGSSIQSSLV